MARFISYFFLSLLAIKVNTQIFRSAYIIETYIFKFICTTFFNVQVSKNLRPNSATIHNFSICFN